MTRIILLESRKVLGLFLVDITLAALIYAQRMLLAYRRNRFGQKKKCPYGKPYLYTYKICSHLPYPVRLTREEQAEKTRMFS